MMVLFNFKGFWKKKKKTIEIFHDCGPVEKCHFLHIHIFADFVAKWVTFYFLGILMSYYDDFLQFIRLSKKIQNIKVFHDPGPGEKWNVLHIHNIEDFAAIWVNIYILGILMSYYDGSRQFKGLSEKLKKNEIFHDRGPVEKMSVFAYSHFCRFCSQMSEFWLFRYPDVILWWFSSI